MSPAAGLNAQMSVAESTQEQPRPPAPPRHYSLFVSAGEKRFFWKLRDEGVTLSAEGISWSIGGLRTARAWNEIEAVHLVVAHIPKHGSTYECKIRFRQGLPLVVRSVSASGLPDDTRAVAYREFVETLHARLSRPEFSGVRFESGASEGRALAMKITMGIAAVFFVGLPLALLLIGIAPLLEGLGILGVGTAFVWPLWRMARANEPRTYSPRDLPYDLLP